MGCDDFPDYRRTTELLEANGYPVSMAADGQDGLRRVLLEWPAIVILDLNVPEMAGRAFPRAREESSLFSRIPVVVFTSDRYVPGANAILKGPVSPESLLAVVQELTREPIQSTDVRHGVGVVPLRPRRTVP